MSPTRQTFRKSWPIILLLFILVLIVGGFVRYTTSALSFGRPSQVQVVALADLNNDGRLDAYLGVGPPGEPYVRPDRLLLNQGSGRFTESQQELHQWNTDSVILADMNNDEWKDIIVSGPGVRLYLNNGSGNFNRGSFSLKNTPLVNSTNHDAAVAEINGDGRLDLIACCQGEVWLNNGGAYFPKVHQTLQLVPDAHIALADLNGDGSPDLFAAGSQPDSGQSAHTVWFNDGTGRFTHSGQTLLTGSAEAIALGDLNGDAYPDAIITGQESIQIWHNDGRGSFSPAPQPPLNAPNTRFLFLGDMNMDGRFDLITGGQTGGQIWLNDGQGSFSPVMTFSYEEDQSFAVGDVDNDGLPDIFVAGMKNYQIWRGLGNGRVIPDPPVNFE